MVYLYQLQAEDFSNLDQNVRDFLEEHDAIHVTLVHMNMELNKGISYKKIDMPFWTETFETKNKGSYLYMHAKGEKMYLRENEKLTGVSSQLGLLGFDEESQYFKKLRTDLQRKLGDYIFSINKSLKS